MIASFTDKILEFNPYISELPVDDYVKVGLYKQEQYNQGVQRVQGDISAIAGIEVTKDVHKEYLNQTVNNLKQTIGKVLTSDFSNQQLTGQIGALRGRIMKDPVIQNAVISTQNYKRGIAEMQKAKTEGKLMPQNEYDFQVKANKWLSDGNSQTSFNDSYTPYVDVLGEFYKSFKDIHPDSKLSQDAFRMKDGKIEINPAIQQSSYEGVTPEKVASVAEMVFAKPEIANQLRIEGGYNYRGATPEMMMQNLGQSAQNTVKNINDQIEKLQLQASTDKTANKSEITNIVNQLKNQGTQIVEEYKQAAQLLNYDPEQYKTYAYKNHLKSQLIGNYSWAKTAETFEKNPVFDAEMETLKYEFDKTKFAFEQEKFKYQMKHDADVLNQDWNKALLSAKKKKDADGNDIDEPQVFTTAGNVDENAGKLGTSTFFETKNAKVGQLNQAMYQGVFEIINDGTDEIKNPVKKNADGTFSLNVDKSGVEGYATIEEARDKYREIYAESRKKIMHGKATEEVQKAFSRIDPLVRTVRSIEGKQKTVDMIFAPQIEQLKAKVGDLNSSAGQTNGKNVTQNDLVDLWIAKNTNPESKNAMSRLKSKFGDNLYNSVFGDPTQYEGGFAAKIPALEKAYQKIDGVLSKNKELVNKINERENAYKEAQTAYIPLESTIIASKPQAKEDIRQMYANIAAARIKGNDSGEIEDFQALLKKEGGASEEKFTGANIYGFDRDNNTGSVYLTVGRGGEKRRIKVSESDIANVPGAQANNEFWKRYGDDLSLTGGTTTDVPINGKKGGESTAYIMPRPSGSKYSVKYHVSGNGQTYNLKLYVRDGQGNLIAGPITPGLATSMDGILAAVEALKSDAQLESLPGMRK